VLARIHRFHRALALLRSRRELRWAELAAECGYYDQSHLVLRQRVRAHRSVRKAREESPLDVVVAPPVERVHHERVLHVHEDADRGVYARDRFDGQDRVEEGRAGSAVGLGDLDAHRAELEQLVDEVPRNLRVLVHVVHARPDFAVGELVHAVTEEFFVLAKLGQRGQGFDVLLHKASLWE
jgi:hypothetical protein